MSQDRPSADVSSSRSRLWWSPLPCCCWRRGRSSDGSHLARQGSCRFPEKHEKAAPFGTALICIQLAVLAWTLVS